jgi:hypothetical protein
MEPSLAAADSTRIGFKRFYSEVFLPEHQHSINRGLHVLGTLLGLAYLPAVWLLLPLPWAARLAALLLFPLVHAAPGLIGHRLFERNAAVGDARWRRRDFSPLWFIAANHVLTAQWFMSLLRRR